MVKFNLKVEKEFAKSSLVENFQNIAKSSECFNSLTPEDYSKFNRNDLLLTRHKGAFIKPCPATPNYNCCGLQIFHFGQGCNIACRYCILEAYLGAESLVLFANIDEGINELAKILAKDSKERPKRFCTGEFTDSLLLDKNSALAEKLIKLFASSKEAILELKTKTDNIDHLLSMKHNGHTMISFSVNAPFICSNEEGRAASLEARLSAAKKAAEHGFPIGLHFDPIIYHDGWEDGYRQTAEMINYYLKEANILWISMGCFRYLPNLKSVMLDKFPNTSIYDAEFIKADDGKMRYPRPLRKKMYLNLLNALQKFIAPQTKLYFCMESSRMWLDIFNFDPGTDGLTKMLDEAVPK